MEIELSDEQMLKIAQMAAQLLVAQLQTAQQAHAEILGEMKEFFDRHPEMRGRHKELSAVITRIEKSSPGLPAHQLFEMAAKELSRHAD